MAEQDRIYATTRNEVKDFVFDERVAHVFADMINRSVPGYPMILEMLGVIAHRYVQKDSHCYDLGCSLGASTLAIRHALDDVSAETGTSANPRNSRIFAIDNSSAMVDRCRINLLRVPSEIPTEVLCQTIEETEIRNGSLVVLNFTLQFLPLAQRTEVLKRIAAGLHPGGALVLSEKIAFADQQKQSLLTDLHHGFKRARGYSELEIAQKRSALENVLLPETLDTHRLRLQDAGFNQVDLWFQCFNFVSILAIK